MQGGRQVVTLFFRETVYDTTFPTEPLLKEQTILDFSSPVDEEYPNEPVALLLR